MYAKHLKRAFIYGATSQQERMSILENFRYNELVNTIFLSSVGDTSIDLPEATCLIQISSHYGSRRQEAQRLGRILRAKRRNDEGFNAFFYSLVSKDTQEMFYSTKRQAFLVDQGYAFKVITHLKGIKDLPNLAYESIQDQRELLQNVLLQNADTANMDIYTDDFEDSGKGSSGPVSRAGTPKVAGMGSKAKRSTGNLASLAGGEGMAYQETNKNVNKTLRKEHHPLFKKLYKK
jgi:DNA excision repair protein ERCC-3